MPWEDVTDSPPTMPPPLVLYPSLHFSPCPQFFPPSPTADIVIGITDLHNSNSNNNNTFFSHMTYPSTYSLCVSLVLFVIISATSLTKLLVHLECAVNDTVLIN